MFTGYWQILSAERVQEMTASTCRYGTRPYFLMLSTLGNAPIIFERMATKPLRDLDLVKVYIDDIIIYTNVMAVHTIHITMVQERIR